MHILVVMDPIEKLDLPKDASVGFILAAFRRNWAVSVCSVGELYSLHNQVCTVSHSVEADREHTLKVVSQSSGPLAEFDAVLMRVDPPVNREYLHATHLLDLAERDTLVLNNPRGIRFANEKAYALHFPDLTPYTRLSSSPKQVRSWLEEETPLIVRRLMDTGVVVSFFWQMMTAMLAVFGVSNRGWAANDCCAAIP